MSHHKIGLMATHQGIMTLQLKSAVDDTLLSSKKSQEDFSNMKRYSTELTRQFI